MTAYVLDASGGWPDLVAARDVGYTGIIGYASNSAWKNLTLARVKQARSLGMSVGLVFENSAQDFATISTSTATALGVKAHAQKAALGFPADIPVFAAVDFNLPASEYATTWANIRAFAITAGGEPAVYGEAGLLDYCIARGAGYGWQAASTSWSGGKVSPNACLLQTVGKKLRPVAGSYDENVVLKPDYGSWMPTPPPKPTPTPAPILDPITTNPKDDAVFLIMRPNIGWYLHAGGRIVTLDSAGYDSLKNDGVPSLVADAQQWASLTTAFGQPV